jgi:ABC-type anion transport system duplicated permease subunit
VTPQSGAPLKLFLEHPFLWWAGLNQMERFALLVVIVGLAILAVATWMAVRRRWRRKGQPLPPVTPA